MQYYGWLLLLNIYIFLCPFLVCLFIKDLTSAMLSAHCDCQVLWSPACGGSTEQEVWLPGHWWYSCRGKDWTHGHPDSALLESGLWSMDVFSVIFVVPWFCFVGFLLPNWSKLVTFAGRWPCWSTTINHQSQSIIIASSWTSAMTNHWWRSRSTNTVSYTSNITPYH